MINAEQMNYIKALGYAVLHCIDSTQVLVVRKTARGLMKHGYKFDSLQEAYEYFTSK
jgi:hypothetical protein